MDFKRISSYFLVNVFISLCPAFKRELRFEMQDNSSNLDGLTCAIERHDSARGVIFDPVTETCISLNNTWFSNPSYELEWNFFILKSVTIFTENRGLFWVKFVPAIGGSVIVYMTTQNFDNTEGFLIHFANQDGTIFGFVMELSGNLTDIRYYSERFRIRDDEERERNPFETSDTVYKLEFEISTSQVKTYIDDFHFHSFNHRTSVDNYRAFLFRSRISTIGQIQFIYPNI